MRNATGREQLVKTGALGVRHSPDVIFRIADVAIPSELFADSLRRVDRPMQKPVPA